MNTHKAKLSKINILILVVTIVIIGLMVYGFLSKKENQISLRIPTNTEVLAQRPHIAQADNSYYDMLKLHGLIPTTTPQFVSEYASGSTTSTQHKKELQKIVSQYGTLFTAFDQFAHKPYYFCDDRVKGEVCDYSDIRNLALLNSVRSGLLFEAGKYADAMTVAINTLKFAQALQRPSDSLVEYLISLAVKRISLERIFKILASGKISQDQASNYLSQISFYTDNKSGQKDVLNIEQLGGFILYINAVDSGNYHTFFSYAGIDEQDVSMNEVVAQIQNIKQKNVITWDPYATYNLLYNVYKNEIANIDLPCGSVYPSVWHPDETLDYSKPTKNIIGQLLYTTSVTELNTLNVQRCAIDDLTDKVLSYPYSSK